MRYKTDTSPKVAQILKDKDEEWYTLITPYNPKFLQYFKGVVSWKRRRWDAERKLWTFAPEYLLQVYYYCKDLFDDVIGDPYVTSVLKEKLEAVKEGDSYGIMHLKNTAPDWLVEKVYKILLTDDRSECRHPDKGGDVQKSIELNMAMDKIKARKS
jgi:hypothetical protein